MERFTFDTHGLKGLSAVPAALHQQHLAMEVLRAAWRRRGLVCGVTLLCTVLGVLVASRMPMRYPAEAVIELHLNRDAPSVTGGSSPSIVVEAASIVLGEARIIRSRTVLHRVVEELGLAADPAFNGEGFMTRLTARVRQVLHGERPDTTVTDEVRRSNNAERALLGGLSVQTDNRSYLISVTFTAGQPALAARIANAVAEAYLAQRLEGNLVSAERTAAWLDGQVTATEAQLRGATAAVAAYREQAGLVDFGGQGDTLQQLQQREYGAQLNALVLARATDMARLTRIAALKDHNIVGAANELQSHPAVQAAAQRDVAARRTLAEMRSRFGPKHPAVQQALDTVADAEAALAGEVERAVAALRAALEASQQSEQQMRERLQEMQVAAIQDAEKAERLQHLRAVAAGLRERLTTLTRSRDQAQALQDLRVVPASLIVPAQPPRQPAGLNPILIGLAGIFGGAVLGVAVAALVERLDHGLRTSDDVVAATELRCLGLAPELSGSDLNAVMANLPSAAPRLLMFEEAARLVVSSIGLLATGNTERGRIVVVTSALPGEGRSTLCAGMARVLAMSGRRVLLIDGPPRRFGVPECTDVATRDMAGDDDGAGGIPGITSDGTGSLVVLHRGSMSGLSIDVFASSRLASALEQARKHFDVILVEGPPVMLVADALVLGRMADNVIHVAKWADTRRRSVRAALRRMQDHGVVVDGVVLTRVDVRKHARLNLADHSAIHLRPQDYYRRAATGRAWRLGVHGPSQDGRREFVGGTASTAGSGSSLEGRG